MADNMDIRIVEAQERLERLMLSHPETEKRVKGIISKVLSAARREVVAAARGAMGSDPRGTSAAVKMMVYKSVLGGAVSILDRKGKSGGGGGYEPARKLRAGQRGGNRVPRGQRTQEMMSYSGRDRAMVLRWLNSGTAGRTAGTRGGRLSGNRGSLRGSGFFGSASEAAIKRAAEELAEEIQRTTDN